MTLSPAYIELFIWGKVRGKCPDTNREQSTLLLFNITCIFPLNTASPK